MKKCPHCSEEIQDEAKKCRFCGEWIEEELIENIKDDIVLDLKKEGNYIEKETFLDKYGKKILYIIGILSILSAFGYFLNGNYDLLYNIIIGITIIFALQSHTALLSRIHLGKSLIYKEITFLILGTIIFIFSLYLPQKVLGENPLIIIPWIIYLLMYININLNYYIKKNEDGVNDINLKIKIINILIHLIIIIIILVTSFFYISSDNQAIGNKQNIEEFLSSFLGMFILLYLLCNYIYRKGRGKLGGSTKKNLLLLLRGIYGVFVIELLLLLIINSNYSIGKKNTFKDVNNIASTVQNYNGNTDDFINYVNNIDAESILGKDIQSYMLEKNNIFTDYNTAINQVGNLSLDSKNYNNTYEINNIINNLNNLGKITLNYINKIENLNNKYSNLYDLINSPSGIEINKVTSEFVNSEKEFIKSSIESYTYLLENQNQIEVYENGDIGIYEDNIRNHFNDLVEIMNKKLTSYQNKTSELQNLRQKYIENLNNK